MIFACGLSNYSVGIFHLANHAFLKVLLFLAAGMVGYPINCPLSALRLPFLGFLKQRNSDGFMSIGWGYLGMLAYAKRTGETLSP